MAGAARRGRRRTRRSRSTRCTSARGAATLDAGPALPDATTRSPTRSPTTCSPTASPTSSCCRSWSTRSTDRGATRPPATSPRPPATARRSDLMAMVDRLHQRGVGVILDWVPSHFPIDAHGLARFDGTHLYEHADPRQGYHPDWTSAIFNYGRHEVRSFLISSALCWLDRYHVDGLRVDAVASMLYLDYSRPARRVDPQPRTAAARTSRRSTSCASSTTPSHEEFPDVATFAEESTAWPMVTGADRPRRARLHVQVGHGLDARHAAVHAGAIRCTAGSTTTRSRSAACTRSASTTCCRCPTTRSSTARARCSARCPATTGSASPTCGCCTG